MERRVAISWRVILENRGRTLSAGASCPRRSALQNLLHEDLCHLDFSLKHGALERKSRCRVTCISQQPCEAGISIFRHCSFLMGTGIKITKTQSAKGEKKSAGLLFHRLFLSGKLPNNICLTTLSLGFQLPNVLHFY